MEGKMSSQECSQQEIEDIIVAIAERQAAPALSDAQGFKAGGVNTWEF
jgi:hypothetical protein